MTQELLAKPVKPDWLAEGREPSDEELKQFNIDRKGWECPTERVVNAMEEQGAIQGFFWNVLPELGGRTYLIEWAQDNPGAYFRLLSRFAPNILPVQGMKGDINIQINNSLGRTELDG